MKKLAYMQAVYETCDTPDDWSSYIPNCVARYPVWTYFVQQLKPLDKIAAAMLTARTADRAVDIYEKYDDQRSSVRTYVQGVMRNIWNEYLLEFYKMRRRAEDIAYLTGGYKVFGQDRHGEQVGYEIGEYQFRTHAIGNYDTPGGAEGAKHFSARESARVEFQTNRIMVPRDPYLFVESVAEKNLEKEQRDRYNKILFGEWLDNEGLLALSYEMRFTIRMYQQGVNDDITLAALNVARNYLMDKPAVKMPAIWQYRSRAIRKIADAWKLKY